MKRASRIRTLCVVCLCLAVSAALDTNPVGATGDLVSEAESARDERMAELEALTRDIAVSDSRLAELRREIEALDEDQAVLRQELIETGQRVQTLEGELGEAETRLAALSESEDGLRGELLAQREVLGEVLAALQRIGRRPPPAILVRPEDALASVRSAILLGAVVPDLRSAADKLAGDLRQLVALREEKARERDRLIAKARELAEDRARVQLLIAERQRKQTASSGLLAEEERRAANLADQAADLEDLISRMETEIEAAAKAKAEADAAAAKQRAAAEASRREARESAEQPDRMAPAVRFTAAKGLLPLPVNGRIISDFGDADDFGNASEGMAISTRPMAQVNAPVDGGIVYAGPFRSYGKLLIINAGEGYHILLAGMDQIDVQLGQFVLAGEPVATMASPKIASAGEVDIVSTQPVLYIEFRKDGNSIDPAPWWAATDDEKVGG